MVDLVLPEARRLHSLGFAIIPLHPKSKRPKFNKWTTGPRESLKELEKSYEPGDNIGVRTGEPSKIGGNYLTCIDVDIKDPKFKHEALTKLKYLVGDAICPEVRSGSGNGSRHLYCATKKPFKMITVCKREGFEICVYSNGRQMVLPPSIHPDTGKAYVWRKPVSGIKDFPLLDFSAGIPSEEVKTQSKAVFDFDVEEVEVEWLPISKETVQGIISGENIEDRSAFLLRACQALKSAGLSTNEILSVLTNPKYEISQAARERRGESRRSQAEWVYNYTLSKVIDEKKVNFGKASEYSAKELTAQEEAKQTEDFLSDRDWRQDLDWDIKTKKTKVSLKNLNIILSNSVEGALFQKDLFANQVAYGCSTPWGAKPNQYVQDIDALLIKHWLGTGEFNIEPSRDALIEVMDLIGHFKRTHPVREWLTSLKWDGKSRMDTWIKDYCFGQAEEPYLSEISRKFLLAMVKRVFNPGCQWDYILILEGAQGLYKSSIARAIAGDDWFMDNLPDLRDKDAMLNLQGKWLIELGELTDVKRGDFNLVKQYLVRRIDRVRPHFGRLRSDVPRQSVFIGTVNDGQYLKDPTGNRRFWPVKVGKCDVKGFLKVREQLFAEAYQFYNKEELMLSPEANHQATQAQSDRRIEDDNSLLEQALISFMKSKEGKNFDFDKFKSKDLFVGPNAPWGPWVHKNYVYQTASQVLTNLGFISKKVKGLRVWRRGEVDTPVDTPQRGVEGVEGVSTSNGGRHPPVYEEDFY